METIAARRLDYFGQDPTLIGSRQSLMDDVEDTRRVIKVRIVQLIFKPWNSGFILLLKNFCYQELVLPIIL